MWLTSSNVFFAASLAASLPRLVASQASPVASSQLQSSLSSSATPTTMSLILNNTLFPSLIPSAVPLPLAPLSAIGLALPTPTIPELLLPAASATPTTDAGTLEDINTIHVRRLPFIVAGVSGASSISAWLSTLGSNGQWPASEIDYTSGCNAQRANWPAEVHWQRIETMSAAFHGGLHGASQFVNSSTIRSAITSAMDFWFDNDFTDPSCLDSGGLAACPCGTPGFWNPNWFSNIIGIPQLVIESCLLLNDTLTATQLSNCTNISSRAYATFLRPIVGVGNLTGANTLDVASVGVDLGLLTVNASLLADAYGRVHNEVVIEQALRADGIRPDGSFSQHFGLIYNGNYGKDYTNDDLSFEIEAAGTQFEATTASQNALATLVDGDQWMIFRNILTGVLHWDFSVLGRFISFPVADGQATASIKINITEFQVLGQAWGSKVLTDAFNNLSRNTTNANVGSLKGNRNFFDNDYMVQRGKGYVTSLRMFSTRTQNTECVNSQNPFGFHLSDGTVYNYLSGNEYEDIAAAWDWNLIPGTTVDYAATPLSCGSTGFAGLEAFVGGASTGTIGVGAMSYVNPLTKALSWNKAWFFLDNDVQHVMINSIQSSSGAPVFSVLDQRRHVSDILIDGMRASSGNFSAASSLWHGNVGYKFANLSNAGVSLSINQGNRTGNWSALGISTQPPPTIDLFSAWLFHENVTAPSSYSAFPATTAAQFQQKQNALQLLELQNDGNVSAVLDIAHQTAMIVFWQPSGGNITIPPSSAGDAPVSIQSSTGLTLIVREQGWNVTVADPSQTFASTQVTFQLGSGRTPRGWKGGQTKQVKMTLPSGGLAGSSVSTPLFP